MKVLCIFKSASPAATSLTAWSLVILLLKIFLFNQWTAPFQVFYDLGVLNDAILTSIIASYVFYLIVVHLKELNDQETISPYINEHTMRVVAECEQQINDIAKTSGASFGLETVTVQSLTAAFTAIAPYSAAPLVLGAVGNNADWFQYFDFHKQRTKESISKVLAQLIYLDVKHVSLLVSVDDCSHFSIVQHLLFHKISNPDLSSFTSTFYEYCQHVLTLKRYIAKRK